MSHVTIGGHGLEGQVGEGGGSAREGSSFQIPGGGGERLFTAKGGGLILKKF